MDIRIYKLTVACEAAHGGPSEGRGADAARAAAHGGPIERKGADSANDFSLALMVFAVTSKKL